MSQTNCYYFILRVCSRADAVCLYSYIWKQHVQKAKTIQTLVKSN